MITPSQRNRPLRVLQFVTRLGLGGAERVALSIEQGLRNDFEFAVFAVRGTERSGIGRAMRQSLIDLNVPLFEGSRVPIKAGGMVVAGFHGARAVRAFRPDIVHLHTEIPESAYAAMIAMVPAHASAAIVRTIHNSVYWHFWPRLGRWCERRMRRSHVACVSQDAMRAFEEFRAGSGAGPLPASPVVVYNGVALPARARAQRRENAGRVRVLFAGRFETEKGSDLLPEVFSLVPPPPGGGEFVVHGSGRHAAALAALAASPPSGWTIRVEPPVADLPERMAGFDLVLMPSRFEGLGMVAVEALLVGLPVIGTDAPGLREALPPDYPWRAAAGDARSFARAFAQALAERARWPAVTLRAQEFAAGRFGFDSMCSSYRTLYLRAAGA